MCPAVRCALTPAGHAGPALHDDSALCVGADRVVRPYGVGCRGRRLLQSGTSRTPSPTEWDVEDAVPYRGGTRRTLSHTKRDEECRAGCGEQEVNGDDLICGKSEERAVPHGDQPAVLRPGGGVRRAAVLQHVYAGRGAHHHGERRLRRAAAQAVPQGLRREV